MNSIIINPEEFDENRLIGWGAEGCIYIYDDNTVIKLFGYDDSAEAQIKLKNKIKKIELLSKIQIDGFVFPKAIILDKYSMPMGYSMDYVKAAIRLYYFLKDKSLEVKVKYLILLEELLKKAHKENIFVGDISGDNELVNLNLELKMTDTDNYAIENLKPDVLSSSGKLYLNKISKEIDSNFDKFIFAIFSLNIILNCFSLFNLDDLNNKVKEANFPKELKEIYFNIFSDSKEKEYLGEHLNLILKK